MSEIMTIIKLKDLLENILESLLDEEDSYSTIEAHRLGLVARPYGYWADPRTGRNVARSLSGQLVKLIPKPEVDDREDDNHQGITNSAWNMNPQKDISPEDMKKWKEYYNTDNEDLIRGMYNPPR